MFSKTADFNKFIEMCQKQKSLYGNAFTYTLIDERVVKKNFRRKLLYLGIAVGIGLLGYSYYKTGKIIPKIPKLN